jgi:dihydroorotase-like cyclic amidohydrolase
MGFDLVIRGATVVTSGHREVAGIGVADGRIAQLSSMMTGMQELGENEWDQPDHASYHRSHAKL